MIKILTKMMQSIKKRITTMKEASEDEEDSEIDEEDVLAVEKMDKTLVKKYSLKKLLTASEIERLKKMDDPLLIIPVRVQTLIAETFDSEVFELMGV